MDEKALFTLEFPKVLERLARHASFSLSEERARALRPVATLEKAEHLLAETSEARKLLGAQAQMGVGGARDVRAAVQNASRGLALTPVELLDIKGSLVAARSLARRLTEAEASYPLLAAIATSMPHPG